MKIDARKLAISMMSILGLAIAVSSVTALLIAWTGNVLGIAAGFALLLVGSVFMARKKGLIPVLLILVGFTLLMTSTSGMILSLTGNYWGIVLGITLILVAGFLAAKKPVR